MTIEGEQVADMLRMDGRTTRGALLSLGLTLILSAMAGARQDKPYRGAEYRTKAAYTYGRFEVRMKSAAASGMLTSFFTYHDPFPFSLSDWNEIDIEILGRYQNEVQFNTITPNRIDHVQRHVLKFNPHAAFHVYGFEWTPDYVAWRVDGYEVYRQTAGHIATLNRPQKIMMNIWQPVWVDWAGTFDPVQLPLYGYYDWVKYYAYTPGSGDNFTLQWIDDFDSWDQTRWDKATHTFDGNNARFDRDNVVFKDGYMVLCLTTPQETGYRGGAIVDEDVDPPYLVWALALENRVHVFLSEALEPAAAENPANYIIPGVTIRDARLLPDLRSVELTADSLVPGKSYVLVVKDRRDRATPAHKMGVQQVTVTNGLSLPARINVGGEAEGDFLADQVWEFSRAYGVVGGKTKARPEETVISGSSNPVYQTEVEGLTFYRARLLPGRYDLTLLFADTESNTPGQRVFDVIIEGRLVLDDLDIVATAGKSTAFEKQILNVDVGDGVLDLYFKPEAGEPTLSGLVVERSTATAVKERQEGAVPRDFDLQVYPNPFNPAARIRISLAADADVEVILSDVTGRLVRSFDRQYRPKGEHFLELNAAGLGTGVYFLQLLINGRSVRSRKITHLK